MRKIILVAFTLTLGAVSAAWGQATRAATGPTSREAAAGVSDEAVKKYAEAVVADRKDRQEGIKEKIANLKVFITQAEAGKITGSQSVSAGAKPVYTFKDATFKAQMIRELKADLARFEQDAKPLDRPWTAEEPVNVRGPTKEGELASFPKTVQIQEIRPTEIVVNGFWEKVSKDKRSHMFNMEPRIVRGVKLKDAKEMESRLISGLFVVVGTEKVKLKVGPPTALVLEVVDAKAIAPRINAAIKDVVKGEAK